MLGLTACAPTPEFTGQRDVFEFDSQSVGDSFEISVHLPPGYDSSGAGRPVLFQLDGSVHGEQVSGIAESLGLEIVVVGIGYDDGFSPNRRRRDDSPTVDTNYDQSGGADEFLSFVTTELFPRIEGDYQVDVNDRTIMGHSQGGLAAAYFALSQPAHPPSTSAALRR